MFDRNKLAQIVGEFLGTAVLASVMLAMIGRTDFPFFVAIVAALTYSVMWLVLGATSGSHLNPAVTIGLWTLRKIETTQAIVFVGAQVLGGVAAWKLNEYLINSPLRSVADKAFDWRVFVAEVVGTFVFAFGLAAAASRKYEGGVMAAVAGGALALGIVVASFASHGLLNPAVAIGVRSWSWTYATAPLVGAIVGMNLWSMLFGPAPLRAARTTTATTTARSRSKRTTKRKK
jgi:aquaporin Z